MARTTASVRALALSLRRIEVTWFLMVCSLIPSSVAICSIVRRALDHAGLNPAHKGAHLLRHSVATHMLRQGASLAEIGALLRHHSPQTTMIYAKVDLDLLRPLAMP